MQGGASARTAAYWWIPGGTKHSRGIAVVREGEWRHEEVAPSHERRRVGEAAGALALNAADGLFQQPRYAQSGRASAATSPNTSRRRASTPQSVHPAPSTGMTVSVGRVSPGSRRRKAAEKFRG